MKVLHMVTFALVIVGGLNWLLFGLFGWELGQDVLGGMDSTLSKVVYIVVGLAAVYEAVMHGSHCRMCKSDMNRPAGM